MAPSTYGATTLAVLVLAAAVVAASAANACSKPGCHEDISLDSDTLSWFVIGDWGAHPSDLEDVYYQNQVEKAMDTAAKSGYPPNMIINVGDNFYNNGVSSTTDPRWKETFEDVYDHHAIEVPWYSVLGNHDYDGNPQAEVEYSQQGLGSGRWIMPERYYSKTFTFGAGTTAQFVFIDTMMLATATTLKVAAEELEAGEISKEIHDSLVAQIHADAVPYNGTLQLEWLHNTLSTSTADWLFVVGHYPVYSGGSHGNTPELQEQVLPMLNEFNVDAYMDGHDHTMQVLTSEDVYYYVSGGGCQTSHHMTHLPQTLYGVDDKPGFDYMTINADTLEAKVFHASSGKINFEVTQTRRPKSNRRL